MIGVVLVAHDGLAEALVKSVRHILGGRLPELEFVSVSRLDPVEKSQARLREAIEGFGADAQVLLFSDLYGSTPANIAMSAVQANKVEMISGVNLPMLLRALSSPCKDLAEMRERALGGGRDGIVLVSEQGSC